MNLSAEHIQRLAAETGFRLETLEKVIRLGELVADIGRHPLLSRVLALKGGTALYLMFGSPARLSVDLDFNYIGQEERAGMLAGRSIFPMPVLPVRLTVLRWISIFCFVYHLGASQHDHYGNRQGWHLRTFGSCLWRNCLPGN